MDEPEPRLRWGVEKRLGFLEFRLYWDGRVNRGDLVRTFGISVPQASADLAHYQNVAPGNTTYDRVAKTYVAGPDFRPRFFDPSADRYLAQLRAVAAGILSKDDTWFGWVPEHTVVPVVRRHLDSETLRLLVGAIRAGRRMRVKYQSLARPAPRWRWITPHALGFGGARWHARAWCPENGDFRDFVLARILEVGATEPGDVDAAGDAEWHRQVTLRLAPNPALTDGGRRAIEIEYGMTRGEVAVSTRVCFSYYLERTLGLDLDPESVGPERLHVVLVNREEVDTARADARAASGRVGRRAAPTDEV